VNKLKIVTIVGARPQIIKAAAISRAIINSFSNQIEEVIVHTGQHYDENMSAVFFDELEIPTEKYNLGVGSQTHSQQTAMMMTELEKVLLIEKPDAVVVYGDTNSTLAASITASKMFIPIVHIEAGLRSFNKKMPEEINRICCDHVSTLLFAPTNAAIKNLAKENFAINTRPPFTIDKPAVFHCGDVMFDNSIYFKGKAERNSTIVNQLGISKDNFVLVTIHRDSNTDNAANLTIIFKSILEIAEERQIDFVIPLHPRTRKMMESLLNKSFIKKMEDNKRIKIISPVSFLDMIALEASCKMIMTDSGGVQKESYFFNKPCIILRNETEWIELVKQGTAKICGANKTKIKNAFTYYDSKTDLAFPPIFGDGKAAEFICREIVSNIVTAQIHHS
jgi:UDP-GlcNAc3NAcA epimerase